jgi:hypothetical protein
MLIKDNKDLVINYLITSEDDSCDREFYYKNILDKITLNTINNIIDGEVFEYKPELLDSINFDIYFFSQLEILNINYLTPYMENNFIPYIDLVKEKFVQPYKNNVFQTIQDNTLPISDIPKDITIIQSLINKPYVVKDVIGESLLHKPKNNGLPFFYNSFTLPFWEQNEKWVNDPLLYSNKSFFYNSFLLLEFFSSPERLTQKRIQTIPIYISKRINITEKNDLLNIHYERPSFNLTEGCDGFSVFYVNNNLPNKLYVKYSFWDALNNKKISLLPSTTDTKKKWLQNNDSFANEMNYLLYDFDFNKKTYKIYEYNSVTKKYDILCNNIDLYQLEFDKFFTNSYVPSVKPINSKLVTSKNVDVDNPFSFKINNLAINHQVKDDDLVNNEYVLENITDEETFLKQMKKFVVSIQQYINSNNLINKKLIKTKENIIDGINKNVSSLYLDIKNFNIQNIDDNSWNINNMIFDDLVLTIDGENFKTFYNKESQSLWNDSYKFTLTEGIFILPFKKKYHNLIQLTNSYLYEIDFFDDLLDLIERNRYYAQKNNIYKISQIKIYLDYLFITLGVSYDSDSHISDYTGYHNDMLHSELYGYKTELKTKFNMLEYTDINKYNEIKSKSFALLDELDKLGDPTQFVSRLINILYTKFNPINCPKSINNTIEFLKDFNNITYNDVQYLNSLNIDNINFEINHNNKLRDYVFEIGIKLNNDGMFSPNKTGEFNLFLSIGDKIKSFFDNKKYITINGNIKLRIINNTNNIKIITIPVYLNVDLNPNDDYINN